MASPDTANQAQAGVEASLARASERQHHMTDSHAGRVAQFGCAADPGIQPEDSQIGTAIPSRERGRNVAPVGQGYGDFLVSFQRVIRSDHYIGPPQHTARRHVLPPVNRYHRPARAFGRSGEIIR
jgi:hypothetical protein